MSVRYFGKCKTQGDCLTSPKLQRRTLRTLAQPLRPDDGRLRHGDAFENAYAAAISSPLQPKPVPLPLSMKALVAIGPVFIAPFWASIGIVLALLALRDICRANGLLRGEILAHFAVVIYGAILCLYAGLAVDGIYYG